VEIKQNTEELRNKVVFCTNLEQMLKRKATDLDTQPTTKQQQQQQQQRLTCGVINGRLLPDDWCCLSDKGNEIVFRINISPPLTTIAGLDGTGQ
jgi:hypothetical protein